MVGLDEVAVRHPRWWHVEFVHSHCAIARIGTALHSTGTREVVGADHSLRVQFHDDDLMPFDYYHPRKAPKMLGGVFDGIIGGI